MNFYVILFKKLIILLKHSISLLKRIMPSETHVEKNNLKNTTLKFICKPIHF